MRLNAKTRRKANKELDKLNRQLHESPGLALAAILEALEAFGLTFGMLFQPKTGTTRSVLLLGSEEVSNALLSVQTHEMRSGRVELTAYVA